MGISVIIITRNEEAVLRDCLESVRWADEIILLDSGSSDNTVQIAKQYTDKVYTTDWQGFGVQKNRALKHVSNQWVLSIDADERVSPQLAEEIRQITTNPSNFAAFAIPFKLFCFGRQIKHGVAWHEQHIRLFDATQASFTGALVHEDLVINGAVDKLNNAIDHYSCRTVEQMLNKMNSYSSAGAKLKSSHNKKGGIAAAIYHALWVFIKIYILKLGFLDGKAGFIISIANAEGSFYKYVKLWANEIIQ